MFFGRFHTGLWRARGGTRQKHPGTLLDILVIGIYLVSAKMFRCAIDNSKKSFYRFVWKVGRMASEHVTVELLRVKCLAVLLGTWHTAQWTDKNTRNAVSLFS